DGAGYLALARDDAVFLDLLVQHLARETERFGGGAHVVVVARQRIAHGALLVTLHELAQRPVALVPVHGRAGGIAAELALENAGVDDAILVLEGDRPFHHVLELAHIAGPRMTEQKRARIA